VGSNLAKNKFTFFLPNFPWHEYEGVGGTLAAKRGSLEGWKHSVYEC